LLRTAGKVYNAAVHKTMMCYLCTQMPASA